MKRLKVKRKLRAGLILVALGMFAYLAAAPILIGIKSNQLMASGEIGLAAPSTARTERITEPALNLAHRITLYERYCNFCVEMISGRGLVIWRKLSGFH